MTTSRTALVTGADHDLGYHTSRLLADQDVFLIAHADNLERGEELLERLVKGGADPLRLELVCADFTNLAQVAAMARHVGETHPELSLLVHAKTTAGTGQRIITTNGNEHTFQINYLAPYLLTRMLHDALATVPGNRTVFVGSMLHTGGSISWTDLNRERRYSQRAVYAQSTLAVAMFTRMIARQRNGSGSAVCTDPGSADPALLCLHGPSAQSRPDGADVLARLCAPDFDVANGAFYDRFELGPVAVAAAHERALLRLWKRSAAVTGLA